MTEIQIAWLELMTVGGLGVILVLLGVTFNIIVKRQNQLCTKQTDGIVKQYGFPGNGRVYPIVEYFVNGTCYKTKKKFRGIKTMLIWGLLHNSLSLMNMWRSWKCSRQRKVPHC